MIVKAVRPTFTAIQVKIDDLIMMDPWYMNGLAGVQVDTHYEPRAHSAFGRPL